MMKIATSLMVATACFASVAQAKQPPRHPWPQLGVETRIVFPNHGAIRNFEADGDHGVWLEDRQRRWYYAELLGPCTGLNFAQAIGFDTGGTSSFDKFSSITVDGQRCSVIKLITSEKPLSKKERKKVQDAVLAAGAEASADDTN